jgi:predicted dehydrogenase
MKKTTIAVIGCGVISQIYLQNLTTRFPNVEVKCCCSLHMESARKRAEQFGIGVATMDEILADPEIEMVVVLTPPDTHFSIIKQALLAGKHVYTEKVLSLKAAEAKELCDLANKKGLYLGSAPDTFMGAAWQKCKQVMEDGTLGSITGFDVYVNRNMDYIACAYPIVRMVGGGVLYDFGVYHLTALIYLLGRVKEVCAVVENNKPIRIGTVEGTPDFGKEFAFNNEAQVTALLRMESGVVGTFTINGETLDDDGQLLQFRFYGEKGVMALPNPNFFGGPVLTNSGSKWKELPNDLPYSDNSRGLGPAEMAQAIKEGRPNVANKEQALHVVAVMEAIMESSQTGRFIAVRY